MEPLIPKTNVNSNVNQYSPEDDWSDYENLMKAINLGFKYDVEKLLAKGCRVVKPGTFNSPLHLALEKIGWTDIVKKLLNMGAKVGFRNAKNDTALHHAFYCEVPDTCIDDLVSSYLKDTNENLVNSDGLTYFHIVCARSKLIYVQMFLKKAGIDVNSQIHMDSKTVFAGFTALHLAVEFDKLDNASYLLKNNASVYTRNANGTTPLHWACYCRNIDMIDLLLENDGVYIDVMNKLGTTHFMAACMSTNPDFARMYVTVAYRQYNVWPITFVNTKMLDSLVHPYPGYTALHFAAEFGRLETVKMLLRYGALCCALTTRKETPFMLARRGSRIWRTEVCKILKQHCESFLAQMLNQSVEKSPGISGY